MKGLAGPFQLDLSKSVLGRSGPRLIQTLANGSKGLKAAGDEAASLGIIIDPADIVKMNQAGNSMQKIWRVLNSLTAVIATAAIPLIEKVTQAVIEWGKANRGLTLERWTRIFSQLEEGLPKIITAVVQLAAVLGAVFGFLNTFAEFLGGWDKIIIGLVGVKFLMLIVAVVQLGAAVLGVVPAIVAFGVAFAAPIAAVLALAAAAYLIYRNWVPISEFFTELWEKFRDRHPVPVNQVGGGGECQHRGDRRGERDAERHDGGHHPQDRGAQLHHRNDQHEELHPH